VVEVDAGSRGDDGSCEGGRCSMASLMPGLKFAHGHFSDTGREF